MALTAKEVQTLYAGYLGRPADFEGLKYWLGNTTQVTNIEELAQSFYDSAEGKKLYPDNDVTNNINAIYMNLFNRTPDTAGYDYWFNEIVSGKINLAKAVVAIYYGAIGNDKVIAENKVNAAVAFTDQVAASDTASLYYGDKAFASAQSFLATVGETPATAQQIAAAVAASENQSSANGETFTLTADLSVAATSALLFSDANKGFSNAEKFLTVNNDIVNLLSINTATGVVGSINITDDSNADNDIVKFIITGTNIATSLDNLKTTGIETLEITNSNASLSTNALKLNTNFKGLQTINLKGDGFGGSGLDISGLTSAVTVNGTDKADFINVGTKYKTGTVINGGDGEDTVNIGAAAVNFAKSALSSVENLKVAQNGSVSFWEGAGVENVTLDTKGEAVLHGKFTNETDNVKKSGDFSINDVSLTYFDNVVGDVVTITFTASTKLVADGEAGTITATL